MQKGGKRTAPQKPAPKWVSTGRTAAVPDGTRRSLYKNAGRPGVLCFRRMATRGGRRVATYVEARKKVGGGFDDEGYDLPGLTSSATETHI